MSVRIEIIAVGSELLRGLPAENNSAHISKVLHSIGLQPERITVVGDAVEAIAGALAEAMSRSDVIIATGGLGPTADDVTREAAIEALGGRVEKRGEILDAIERKYEAHGKRAPIGYRNHADVPYGAEVLANCIGAAPGLRVERDGTMLYLLPGVPAEMKEMFDSMVLPELIGLGKGRALCLRTFGQSESEVEDRLRNALGEDRIGSLSIISGVTGVDCYFPPGTWDDETIARARGELGSYLYAEGDLTMEELCVRRMARAKTTLATAESFTGGLLASRIVGVPGASDVFLEGFVTYSNEAKIKSLGVTRSSLDSGGAVSEEVCVQMAEGARERAGSDIALSTTGIAGPGGATDTKPAGYCFVGLATARASYCANALLGGGREMIRGRAVSIAIDLLRHELEGNGERLDPLLVDRDKRRSGS
jgi:nicotinamide-nucleotide amidase